MELTSAQLYVKDMYKILKDQKDDSEKEFKRLFGFEKRFAENLRKLDRSKGVYKKFVKMIKQTGERGLLEARPYFREREDRALELNSSIARGDVHKLAKFKINFLFCKFAMDNLEVKPDDLCKIYSDLKSQRDVIITKYLTVALNNAKKFNGKSNKTMDFSDHIQLANEGIITAVDKFYPDPVKKTPFRYVATGWMISKFISEGSYNSPASMGANAIKKLYQVRKAYEKNENLTTEEVSAMLNIAEKEVAGLINGCRYFSLDEETGSVNSSNGSGSEARMIDFFVDPHSQSTQDNLEQHNLQIKTFEFYDSLDILEKKILLLKGFDYEGYTRYVRC